jgi:hypothetical protein
MSTPTRRGYAYPLAIDNGGLALAEDDALTRNEVISVLQTRPFERVMRPEYGTPDYIFDAVGPAAAVSGQVQVALETQVEGAEFAVNGEVDDLGEFRLIVAYEISGQPQPVVQFRLTR